MIDIPYTETLISFGCNLHCDGCQNYTNYNLKGNVDFDEAAQVYSGWSKRINPEMFRLLGGEPFLHPDLSKFIRHAAECWPKSQRFVVTNGLLAERRSDIVDTLIETGTIVELSIHSNDPRYLDRLRPAMRALKTWANRGVTFYLCDSRRFIRTYRGIGENMRPFNHDPVKSWDICTARNCVNIYQGRLWKCPTISMLRQALEKFNLQDHSDWKPHLEYQGLPIEATDEELSAFINRGPENICSICPEKRDIYYKDIFNVDFKSRSDRAEVQFPNVDINKFIAEA